MGARMELLCQTRCTIGEGPLWHAGEGALYYTDGLQKRLCRYEFATQQLTVLPTARGCAALAPTKDGRMLASCQEGVFWLDKTGQIDMIYDTGPYEIKGANDMKAGPDGRLYVGTQSSRRLGLSSALDGRLYVIDPHGRVRLLLDHMSLSNGMDWSMDEERFYHTDSDTGLISEYDFDGERGTIAFTGRQIAVPGVDGFCMGRDDCLYAACWGQGHIAVIETGAMRVVGYLPLPCRVPASCCFAGPRLDVLAVTTACYEADIGADAQAGFTVLLPGVAAGRAPYLFG